MKTFLQEVADAIRKDFTDWDNLTVIFPNRRAALFFRKALSEGLNEPKWAPAILSIEEFINSFSKLKEAEKLSLIVILYRTFKNVTHSTEDLDHFYFWGEMLLRDFDEIDKYLVSAESIFTDLSNQKEIDQYFDYLTDEQKKFLRDFWQTIEFNTSENKVRFLELWRNLFKVYDAFKNNLLQQGIGYSGMIHRQVTDQLDSHALLTDETNKKRSYVFAGFNALTAAEEKIISWFVKNRQAKIFWDEDRYYVNAPHREAGTFFRQYREHPVLGKTFPQVIASHLEHRRSINILGVSQRAGQPKLLAQQLEEQLKQVNNEESTVVVLPDENLLLPVLYALPSSLDAVNVTMGFPLTGTPYFSFVDFLFDLHLHKRKDEFYHRYVLTLFNHPYLKGRIGEEGMEWREYIIRNNQVYIAPSFFEGLHPLLRFIFAKVNDADFFGYALSVIEQLATSPDGGIMEKEFAFQFHRIISTIQDLVMNEPMELRMQQRLFRQVVRSEKVPFNGEPLKGIQIMGVLETRNLDFENVNVLSLNEGLWPASSRQNSYLPHNIRRAYGLPTSEHQDAMYAYLFYRLLQRAQHVDLYYNTEPDVLGASEMSRYLYQIIYETGWDITRKILHNPVLLRQADPITIEKRADVLEKLERYLGKPLTPSTLNTYLECRLKFYFRHLIEIKEPDQVEEEADARIFGNIFHRVMELFYKDIRPPAGDWEVREEHFKNLSVKLDRLIERAFRDHFHLTNDKKFDYEGRQLVVKEMVKKFAEKVLDHDQAHAPFMIELLEENNFNTKFYVPQRDKTMEVVLGGKIDRIDRKDGLVRIIDYKTGKDENSFDTIGSLFVREGKRNKAAFQAMMYAWVYRKRNDREPVQLQTGLLNRKEMFGNDFRFGLIQGRELLSDVTPLLPAFEEHLQSLVQDLFNPEQPFDQTEDHMACLYCPYKEICSR